MKINVLDERTIDKIAAGEVVERPSSVVKELVENAIDAGADAVSVEIREGGVSLIRVTDNGAGIEKSQIRNAFLRHATSKISSEEDLRSISSLGFRGEALASIAAVSMVEAVSKVKGELTGVRYVIEGGVEKEEEEVGAPDGSTFIVRSLFYNTPARRKFLKQPQSEGAHVAELMERLAISRPDISFNFVMNGQGRFHTSGNNDLKEIIYRIYGKDIASALIEIHEKGEGFKMDGYIGKPVLNRSNRGYELFYINGRYVKSTLISKAVEEGAKEYLMQHKFPFCVLNFTIDTGKLDVNVHPSKMEVRISGGQEFYEEIRLITRRVLRGGEMIPDVSFTPKAAGKAGEAPPKKLLLPEPFEVRRLGKENAAHNPPPGTESSAARDKSKASAGLINSPVSYAVSGKAEEEQLELFGDRLLSKQAREKYEIIGQVFDTYWLVAYEDKLLIIDQHAAHEKVKYERLMKQFKENNIVSQLLSPPLILNLNSREKACLEQYSEHFSALGFVLEEFGGNDYALRSVPMEAYGLGEAQFFYEFLDELSDENTVAGEPEGIRMKIATMACKSAVKGNTKMSAAEAGALIDELLMLDNPYNCPHGRPTIISMSKYELEKNFKRSV